MLHLLTNLLTAYVVIGAVFCVLYHIGTTVVGVADNAKFHMSMLLYIMFLWPKILLEVIWVFATKRPIDTSVLIDAYNETKEP